MCFILYVCVTYLRVTDMAYMSDIVCVTDMAYMSDIVSVRHSVAQMSEICVSQIPCDNSHTPHLFRTQSLPPLFFAGTDTYMEPDTHPHPNTEP